MKMLVLYKVAVAVIGLTILSCNTTPQNEQNSMTFDPSTVQPGPVVHDTLTASQIEKITFIHNTFVELQSGTLEKTITDFKRDHNPDSEIAIWLSMASAYSLFVQKKGAQLDQETKREAYKLIVLRSVKPEKEATADAALQRLSSEDVKYILSAYNQAPKPVKVEVKE